MRKKESVGLGEGWIICVMSSVALGYLKLWGENGFKLQAQSVLAVFKCRWCHLLVSAKVLQRLLSSLSGLEPVHHLTGQKIGTLITPLKGLHTRKHRIQ